MRALAFRNRSDKLAVQDIPAVDPGPGLLASVAAGTLRAPVARTYPLDRATQALADFSAHKLGKLVNTVP
jgi:hypothetical protein